MDVHALLRRETLELHDLVERKIDFARATTSIEGYRSTLESLHGYYKPMQERISSAPWPPAIPTFALASWTTLLTQDLRALGRTPVDVARLPRCAAVPTLDRAEHLAGCLYVLEGASLGGQVIASQVERRLGLSRERGLSFFAGEGSETGRRWRRVLAWLDAVVRDGAEVWQMVTGARATFATLGHWIDVSRVRS